METGLFRYWIATDLESVRRNSLQEKASGSKKDSFWTRGDDEGPQKLKLLQLKGLLILSAVGLLDSAVLLIREFLK